ncbi:hypothetical protein CHS0354_022486 [Potamilus streckersoni]|uniref:Uncharacterized protein n=1 Tax=Potamilus streckersoni TaxID=2493646 RepID=A0AAE0SYF3_9BIVA|nr:hypothetical protein CHS0354_022486 [Potamilus streckersoni]
MEWFRQRQRDGMDLSGRMAMDQFQIFHKELKLEQSVAIVMDGFKGSRSVMEFPCIKCVEKNGPHTTKKLSRPVAKDTASKLNEENLSGRVDECRQRDTCYLSPY